MNPAAEVAGYVRGIVGGWPKAPGFDHLNELLRMLGRWRSQMIASRYISLEGARVWSGPFAGMDYVREATEGALSPRLFGTYESELHPHLARIAAEGVDVVIDVGCAEGYYAVGLARMLPGAVIHARDTDPAAQARCADLAARNGVEDRVLIGGEFKPADFQAFAGLRALVLVDVEGAELQVLRPDLAPALAGMQVIVETHDVYAPGSLNALVERFTASHDIVRVDQQPKAFHPPDWFHKLAHLDQLLAVWEWRAAPTPWLVMTPKA